MNLSICVKGTWQQNQKPSKESRWFCPHGCLVVHFHGALHQILALSILASNHNFQVNSH